MDRDKIQDAQIFKAPEFMVKDWIDGNGKKTNPVRLSDLGSKFKVVYCFQSWCPGCHNKGFPDLKKMVNVMEGHDDIVFLAVQTVFEGFETNTLDKISATQKQYDLHIPFGHDVGDDGKSVSNMMTNYKTKGTPWFIFIDQHNNVVFADFRINVEGAIRFFKERRTS